MTLTREFDVSIPPGAPRGRTIKFTPERMDQIRNLVERGTHRSEIAEIIGCTVGSLQVTCSKAGISLRMPRNGTPMTLPTKRPPSAPPPIEIDGNGNGNALEPTDFTPPRPTSVSCVLRISVGNRSHDLPLPLSAGTIAALALMAELNGMRIGELITAIIRENVGEITS